MSKLKVGDVVKGFVPEGSGASEQSGVGHFFGEVLHNGFLFWSVRDFATGKEFLVEDDEITDINPTRVCAGPRTP